jgi:chromate transporter
MDNGGKESDGRVREVAGVFLRLGATAFGGPAAHIAMMDEELVQRRQWLDRQEFLDLLGATNLIPGPNSTELAIHLGYKRAGWRGLIAGGACFILPAMLLVGAVAYLYQRFGSLPQTGWLLYGVKPVIIAIVAQALWNLVKTAAKNWQTTAAGVAVLAASLLGYNEIALLAVAGLAVMLVSNWPRGAAPVVAPPAVAAIFFFFLKVGSVLYGSGYVLLAFLQADLVDRWHWLTSQQLLDAIAVGQFTPGPVFTTATFIGYLLGGWAGAIVATVGIFLPAFALVWALNPLVPRLRKSPWLGRFLDGVNSASLGLMAAVAWRLGVVTLIDPLTVVLALASLGVLLRFKKLNSAWLVLAGGVVGLFSHF